MDPFTTVAPQLLDLSGDLVLAKSELGLLVANPGGKKLKVLVGTKKAKVLEVGEVAVRTVSAEQAPVAAVPNVRVRVPRLATNSYLVTVSNNVGPAIASLPLVVALPGPGSGPDFSATIPGKTYNSDASYNLTGIAGIHSCDELPTGACGSSFDIQLPAAFLQAAGSYTAPNSVVYFETTNQWASTSALVTITVPANGTNLARGLFSALLAPISGQGGGDITAIGTFRAAQNPVIP